MHRLFKRIQQEKLWLAHFIMLKNNNRMQQMSHKTVKKINEKTLKMDMFIIAIKIKEHSLIKSIG